MTENIARPDVTRSFRGHSGSCISGAFHAHAKSVPVCESMTMLGNQSRLKLYDCRVLVRLLCEQRVDGIEL